MLWWLITDTHRAGRKNRQQEIFVLFIHEAFSQPNERKKKKHGRNRLAKQKFITENANKMQHLDSPKLLKLDLSQR